MSTTAEQMRAWTGPAVLSFGFRPFFLLAGLWAALSMILWVAMLAGRLDLPTAFDPVSWHAHEFVFGYLGAVAGGFLLTAVPNWTGRLPIVGWPLGGLAALWLLGRAAVLVSGVLTPLTVALADLSFLVVLAAVIAREILAGRNWRNLPVLAMLCLLIAGNALFHWQAAQGLYAAGAAGLRLGLAAGVLSISLIGGRIVPSFTRNWLVRQGHTDRPAPFSRFDKAAIAVTAVTLLIWVPAPHHPVTAAALLVTGLLQLTRLARWSGHRTLSEPLVWVLHAGYAFVPLGALALGVATLAGGPALIPAQHLWMAGAIGVMTMAVMTRATLGHTGRALAAGPGTAAVYLALIASVATRFAAGLAPGAEPALSTGAGLLWIAAFLGFTALYGPDLLTRRKTG